MNRLKKSYSTCMSCGGKKMKSGGKWIKSAIKKPGSFTAQAKNAGMSVPAFRDKVLSNKEKFSSTTVKRANLAKTLAGMRKGEDGMKVSKGELKAARKEVGMIEPQGIKTSSSSLVTPTPIESPANWYNESTWDKAQEENAARPVANTPISSDNPSPLARGGTEKVRSYQEMLRSYGYDIKADGAWGPKTQAAYESYIKAKASGTAKPATVTPAQTTSKSYSETWNYTPEQWDKSMAENKARPAVNSVMATADNMKKTPINTKEVLKTPEPIQVTQAVNNVSKLKKAKSKASSAEALIRRKIAKMNSGKSIYGD